MHTDQIVNRITDLLKLAGVSDSYVLEELTDHYLTHIEEEIKRGVNSQKAVRETYQEIANFDASQLVKEKNSNDKRGLFLFLLLFIGIAFYFFQQELQPTENINNQKPSEEIFHVGPPTGSPIEQSSLKVSSEFGLRLNPFIQQKELHKGIDIRAKVGTDVLSTGYGTVMEAGFKSKAGNYITILHEGDFTTKYYHLSDISVKPNDIVKQGQVIGKVGNSGKSKMPHLHYEVLNAEVHMNPRNCINP